MMSSLQPRVDLQSYHTLACPSVAEFALEVHDVQSLRSTLHWARERALAIQVMGEGSNLVPRDWVSGVTLINRLSGVRVLRQTADHVDIRVAGGVSWHWLVLFSSAQQWFGLENLALIPGTVGAAPVQNIGAYGVELCDVFQSLEATHLHRDETRSFSAAECEFGYRDSVFKREEAGQWMITSVQLRLSRHFAPNLTYGPLADANIGCSADLIARVIAVRRSKLPDPAIIPNAGSFFTNPIISRQHAEALQREYADLPVYSMPDASKVKVAAGWLIEQAGLRGQYAEGSGVGPYEKQALVLINPQRVASSVVMARATEIADAVQQRFGIHIEPEPRLFP